MGDSPSELRLKALQCHFTWDLIIRKYLLPQHRDQLLNISTEGNPWRGHIYNLLGFLQTRLENFDEALNLFTSASAILEGPALLVNYSNLAWLHHERGEPTESQEYLGRVEELREHHEDPAVEQLHPEVLAEKAWTLMRFSPEQKQVAIDLFEQALEEQPQRVEWRSSQAIAFLSAFEFRPDEMNREMLLKVQRAVEEDQENLILSAEYLLLQAKRRVNVEEQVAQLVPRIVESGHSGLKAVLKYYRFRNALGLGIELVERALENHPDNICVKQCAALCYKWRVFQEDGMNQHDLVEKGISLLEEVIPHYPDTSLNMKIDLAELYSKLEPAKAEEMFQTLLQMKLESPETQMLYNHYAKFLGYILHDQRRSIEYHQRAASIIPDSHFGKNSIDSLQKLTRSTRETVLADINRLFPQNNVPANNA